MHRSRVSYCSSHVGGCVPEGPDDLPAPDKGEFEGGNWKAAVDEDEMGVQPIKLT
jgi:hypothetical protein